MQDNITYEQRMDWIASVATGMNHLHNEGILHHDLAARNVSPNNPHPLYRIIWTML